MLTRICRAAVLTIGILLLGSTGWSQTSAISGKVLGEDGEPIKDALVKIERTDVRGNYQVKTKNKGDYFHAGLPYGTYKVTLVIGGKDVDSLNGVRLGGETGTVNFDLKELAARRQQQQKAADGGITEEQLRGMSAEERKRYEESLKQRQEALSKNKQLNATFNTGMEALRAGNLEVAVASLTEASTVDPTQSVIWANLAEAQARMGQSKTGDERSQLNDQAIASYRQAIALKPDDATFYNNRGLILVRMGKIEEGKAELLKAAQTDPVNSGTYYYNLGATMINTGNTEAAVEAFQQAIAAKPDHAEAHFQLGTALVGSAQIGEDGSIKPVAGTIEAFQKYLALMPNGPNAPAAQAMLESLQGSVDTTFKGAKKK
jgi:tetratricopeptide (TPR) repeat protein